MGRKKKGDNSSGTSGKMYFSEQTQEAIIAYNNSNDLDEREHIFRESIAYPLDKLAENVINRFKFPYINTQFDALKRQVVSFLVINLHKYDPSKGTKAFSYFSVIAKNHLILHNMNGWKDEKRHLSISDSGDVFVSIEEMVTLESPNIYEDEDVKEFVSLMIDYWDKNLYQLFKKKRDIDIAMAVIELFRRSRDIENFNKKSLYVYIREMTDCKTSYITKVINRMRANTIYQSHQYYEHGRLDYNKHFQSN